MRTKLKLLRVGRKKTQAEFARIIGCSRAYYSAIESGRAQGARKFWQAVQECFAIPDSEMWELMKTDD